MYCRECSWSNGNDCIRSWYDEFESERERRGMNCFFLFGTEESMTTTMSSETRSHRLTKHYSSRLYSNRSLTSRANEEMFSYSNQCISFRNTNSNDNNGNKQYCNRTWYSNQHFVFNFSLVDIISSDSSSSVSLSILSLIFVCISACVCACVLQ